MIHLLTCTYRYKHIKTSRRWEEHTRNWKKNGEEVLNSTKLRATKAYDTTQWLLLCPIEDCMKMEGSMADVGCGSMKERGLKCLVWCRWKIS